MVRSENESPNKRSNKEMILSFYDEDGDLGKTHAQIVDRYMARILLSSNNGRKFSRRSLVDDLALELVLSSKLPSIEYNIGQKDDEVFNNLIIQLYELAEDIEPVHSSNTDEVISYISYYLENFDNSESMIASLEKYLSTLKLLQLGQPVEKVLSVMNNDLKVILEESSSGKNNEETMIVQMFYSIGMESLKQSHKLLFDRKQGLFHKYLLSQRHMVSRGYYDVEFPPIFSNEDLIEVVQSSLVGAVEGFSKYITRSKVLQQGGFNIVAYSTSAYIKSMWIITSRNLRPIEITNSDRELSVFRKVFSSVDEDCDLPPYCDYYPDKPSCTCDDDDSTDECKCASLKHYYFLFFCTYISDI